MKNKIILSCFWLLVNVASFAQVNSTNGNFNASTSGVPLSLQTFGTTRLTITPSGSVGIGTTSPSYLLDLLSSNSRLRVRSNAAPNSSIIEVDASNIIGTFESTIIPSAGVRIGSKTNYPLRLFSNDIDRVFIGTNGFVGIGTNSPTALLEVVGPSTGSGVSIRAGGGGDVLLNSGGSLFFDGNYSYASGNYIRPTAANTQGFFTSGVQRLTIAPNGNIGIGTDSPSNLQGWARVLDVAGGPHSKILATANNAEYRTGIYSHNSGWHGGGGFVGTESNHNLHLITNYDPKLSILTTGNVGIGTTSPAFKLDVAGPINATALNVNGQPFVGSKWTSSGSNIYYTAGKVGIGTPLTTNPNNYTLAVNGKIGTKDVQIEAGSTTWPDYVFEPTYKLPSLSDVEKYILAHKHLEGVPSAENVEKNGYSMSELDAALLRKLEEMTLYMIEQQKQIAKQQKEIDELKKTQGMGKKQTRKSKTKQ